MPSHREQSDTNAFLASQPVIRPTPTFAASVCVLLLIVSVMILGGIYTAAVNVGGLVKRLGWFVQHANILSAHALEPSNSEPYQRHRRICFGKRIP